MCFSAEAAFVAGAAITVVGVATLTESRGAKELPLAVLPLAFGFETRFLLHHVHHFLYLIQNMFIALIGFCWNTIAKKYFRIFC